MHNTYAKTKKITNVPKLSAMIVDDLRHVCHVAIDKLIK